MEVTKHNFKDALAEVTSLLTEADFISFDLELSGLGASLGERNHDLDTPEERYQKTMRRVKEYGLIQIGMSIFRYCKDTKKFYNATYCFYLSGKLEESYRYDTSCMMFLAEHGFNFNKLFLEGLTFLSLTDEVEIRKKREVKLAQEKDKALPSPIKLKDSKVKAFVNESVRKVKESKRKEQPITFSGKTLGGFYRKLLFSNVANQFPKSHFQNLSGSARDVKVIHFSTEEEKRKFLDKTWEDELDEQIGFTHVVKAILEANKPMVGHNMILDVLHFVDKFVARLPDELAKLKAIVKANMPVVFDTKLMARDPPFSGNIVNTSLGCLYEELVAQYSPPEFASEKDRQSYSIKDDGQAHDGGFDAFMTGVCFITMAKALDGKHWGKSPLMKGKHLDRYSNKITFMGSYDIPFIDINKPEAIPDRGYMYVVSCPSTWSSMNVRHVFGCLKMYRIVWVNETRLFVIPQDEGDKAKAKKLLQEIQSACSPNVTVSLYEQESPSTKNGKVSSAVRGRNKTEVVKPSYIALKRSSEAKEATMKKESSTPEDTTDSQRNLKRLKSVGSELLSNMSLESPMSVDKEPPNCTDLQKDVQSMIIDTSEEFNVPDEW